MGLACEVGQSIGHLDQVHLLLHPVVHMDHLGWADHERESWSHPSPGQHEVNNRLRKLEALNQGEKRKQASLVKETPEEAGHQVEEDPGEHQGGGEGEGRLVADQDEERGEEGEEETRFLVIQERKGEERGDERNEKEKYGASFFEQARH